MGSEGWPPASFLEVVAAATEDSRARPIGFDWAETMHMMLVSQQQQQQQQSCDWGIRPILGGVASRTCDYAMLDFSHPQLSTMAATTTAHSMLRFGSKPPMNQLASFSPRSSSSNTNNIRCQAEGCHADLSAAKHYHRRHKVCQYHSKAATVFISDSPQRFCQQCSRFHPLAEFDDEKRSCRKRLADHNKRRRKTPTDPNIKLAPLIVSSATNQGDEPTSGIKSAHGYKALLALGSNLEADTFRIQNQTNSHAILEKDEELYRKMDGSLSWLHPKLEQPARSEAVTGTSSENLQKPSHAGSHWILRASVNNNNKHDHNSMGLSLHDIKPTEQVQPASLLYHRHSNTFP